MGYCLLHADGFYHNLNICDIQWFHAFSIIYFTNNSVMKKVFHKLRDYVLALLTLMAMSACSESLNTLGNSHFTKEGELIKKPSFAVCKKTFKAVRPIAFKVPTLMIGFSG